MSNEAKLVAWATKRARAMYPGKPPRTIAAQAVLVLAREWDAYAHAHGRRCDGDRAALYRRAAEEAHRRVAAMEAA